MSTLRFRAGAIAFPILLVVLAACGGATQSTDEPTASADASASSQAVASDGGAAATEGDDATSSALCALVPIEQVETALGMTTDGGVGDESFLSGGFTCRFTGDDEHVLDVETSEQTRDEWFEAIETVGLTDEEVTGVGEEAYRAAETALGGPGARFTAWEGGREVGVTIYSDEPQEVTFAAAQAIAEAVLAAGE
jgi:hypothetical protein